jgi:hypothetical protein
MFQSFQLSLSLSLRCETGMPNSKYQFSFWTTYNNEVKILPSLWSLTFERFLFNNRESFCSNQKRETLF